MLIQSYRGILTLKLCVHNVSECITDIRGITSLDFYYNTLLILVKKWWIYKLFPSSVSFHTFILKLCVSEWVTADVVRLDVDRCSECVCVCVCVFVQYTLDHLCPSSRACVFTTGVSVCVCVCVCVCVRDWWTAAGRVCTDLRWWGSRGHAEQPWQKVNWAGSWRGMCVRPLTLADLWHLFLSLCRSLFLWGERRDARIQTLPRLHTHTQRKNLLTSGWSSWVSAAQWYLQRVCVGYQSLW